MPASILVVVALLGVAIAGNAALRDEVSATSADPDVFAAVDAIEVVDEVHYTFTGDTSVAFDWRGAATDLSYGPTVDYGLTVTAAAPSPMPTSSAGPFREVEISQLQPDTTYHYSIGGGPDHTFHTAPGDSYRFVAVGDIGDSLSVPPVAPLFDQIAAEAPSFVLALGDLTYANYHCAQAVDQHFIDAQRWSFEAAYMPVWGNHEYAKANRFSQACGINDTFANYKGRFALPHPQTLSLNTATRSSAPGCALLDGANPCRGEDWYWFDAGPVRYVVGPEPFPGAVQEWQQAAAAIMAEAETDPDIRFVVTASHRPSYASGGRITPEYTAATDDLGDQFPEYVLHLVGHNHVNEVFTPQHGVRHVIAGAGGEGLDAVAPPINGSVLQLRHNGYVAVDVTPTSMQLSVVCGPHGSGATTGCEPGETVASFPVDGAHPVARWDAGCAAASCDFDAAASSDREGGALEYAWDFGDGTTATEAATSHTYASPGVYRVRLSVTDADGHTDDAVRYVTVGSPGSVAFRGATAVTQQVRNHTLTVPTQVHPGDGLVALLTTANPARTLSVPAGWQLVDSLETARIETFVLERVAAAGTAGSTVTLRLSGSAKATGTLLAYSGTSSAGPVGSLALESETVARTGHTTPTVDLATQAAPVVSYWSDRSGSTTGWSTPPQLAVRAVSAGSGTGHTSAVAADTGAPVPAGTTGGATATASTTADAVLGTLLLEPAG